MDRSTAINLIGDAHPDKTYEWCAAHLDRCLRNIDVHPDNLDDVPLGVLRGEFGIDPKITVTITTTQGTRAQIAFPVLDEIIDCGGSTYPGVDMTREGWDMEVASTFDLEVVAYAINEGCAFCGTFEQTVRPPYPNAPEQEVLRAVWSIDDPDLARQLMPTLNK